MRTWQLYLDESGDFNEPRASVLVAGVLFEGRATPQVSSALRRRLEEIFVGSAYPPHAAHHNVATSLLCEALAGREPQGPVRARFLRGIEWALATARGDSPEARALRAAISTHEAPRRPALEALGAFDTWLERTVPAAHATLRQERDLQRGDLTRYATDELARHVGRPPLVVAAWQANAGSYPRPDARYEQLYEVLLERALSCIASRDDGAQLEVHLATRHWSVPLGHVMKLTQAEERASAFPLLARAKSPPVVVRYKAEAYDARVAPGIVLADFAANTLRRALASAASWGQLDADVRGRFGLPAMGACALLPLAAALPSVAADGSARDAIRRAAEGSAQALPAAAAKAEPRWAKEQAAAWIAALSGESAP